MKINKQQTIGKSQPFFTSLMIYNKIKFLNLCVQKILTFVDTLFY